MGDLAPFPHLIPRERPLRIAAPSLTLFARVAEAAPMRSWKTQIALYLALAVAVAVGLYFGVPQGFLILFGAAVGLADVFLSGRQKRRSVGASLDGSAPDGSARSARHRSRQQADAPERSPGIREWALLGVSVGFCVLALLVARDDWRGAAVTFAFFGGCAAWFASDIRRKLRQRKWAGATVQVVGGVNIYMDAPRMGFIALGCFIVGALIFFLGVDFPLLMRAIGAFIALVGVGVGIALALGFYDRQFIRFDPDAVIFGHPGSLFLRARGYTCRVAWDNIAGIVSFDYADNPFVGIQLHELAAVSIDPPSQAPAFLRLVDSNRGLMNVDLSIAALNFGIDGPALAAALQRYALDRDARAELAPRRALPRS